MSDLLAPASRISASMIEAPFLYIDGGLDEAEEECPGILEAWELALRNHGGTVQLEAAAVVRSVRIQIAEEALEELKNGG